MFDIEALKSANMDGKTVSDVVTDKIATIGENMSVRRMAKVEVKSSVLMCILQQLKVWGKLVYWLP